MHKSLIIILAITFALAGCDFVKKINPFAKEADTMEIYLQRQDSIRHAELLRQQKEEETRLQQELAEKMRKEQEEAERLKALERYHLIVGAFKTPAYAEAFHRKMLSEGHDSRIIMSANNFNLVTIRSYSDYRAAVADWKTIRAQGEHLVWLYITD